MDLFYDRRLLLASLGNANDNSIGLHPFSTEEPRIMDPKTEKEHSHINVGSPRSAAPYPTETLIINQTNELGYVLKSPRMSCDY
jgi:hypothetical protein